jgi:hypothetical protein
MGYGDRDGIKVDDHATNNRREINRKKWNATKSRTKSNGERRATKRSHTICARVNLIIKQFDFTRARRRREIGGEPGMRERPA